MRFVAFIIVLSLLAGCQKPCSHLDENRIRVNLVSDPHSLDPRIAKDTCAQAVVRMCFDGLTRIGPDDQPQLALAQRLEVSGLTYRFYLREAFWSNGQRVTARDFVQSWQRVLSPDYPAEMAAQLFAIENAKAIHEGDLPLESLGAVAESDAVLVIRLANLTPCFLEQLATPVCYPVCASVDREDPHWARSPTTYVCNGPFVLKSWRHHDLLELAKNPTYWDRDSVQLDGIDLVVVDEDTELKLFEKGNLDWAGSPMSTLPIEALSALRKSGNLSTKEIAGTRFIRVNTAGSFLDNRALRRALASTINREDLVTHVAQGGQRPAFSLVPPSLLQTELSNHLGHDEFDAPPNGLTLIYAQSERNHLLAQAMQEGWRKTLDVSVHLEALELKVFFDRVARGQYELAIGSWLADYADPANFLEVFMHRNSPSNHTRWESEDYMAKLQLAQAEIDREKRLSYLKEAEEILMDEMAIIPIFHSSMLSLCQPHLKGVYLSPLGQLDFKWAYLNNPEE